MSVDVQATTTQVEIFATRDLTGADPREYAPISEPAVMGTR